MTEADKFSGYQIFSDAPYRGLAARVSQRLPNILKPRRLRAVDVVRPNGVVLDYGCGAGDFLQKVAWHRPDLQLHGCDVVDFIPSDRQGLLQFQLFGGTELPYSDEQFDLVIAQNVLEHVIDPTLMFREVVRVLAPDGIFVCEVPSPRSIAMPSIQLLLRLGQDRDRITANFYDDPTHVRPYSRQSLRRLAKMSGLHTLTVYKARNPLYLIALPLHLWQLMRRQVGPMTYWWYEVYGGPNGLMAKKVSPDPARADEVTPGVDPVRMGDPG